MGADAYLHELPRYIHRNRFETEMVDRLESYLCGFHKK